MRVGVSARGGVFGSAGAARLHEDVVLAGEGDGAERDDEEQVRHVRLHALAVQQVALLGAANEGKFSMRISLFNYLVIQVLSILLILTLRPFSDPISTLHSLTYFLHS